MNQKIKEDLLAPSFKAYIDSIDTRQTANASSNSTSLSDLPAKDSQVITLLNTLTGLSSSVITRFNTMKNNINNYNGTDGKGQGIKFAYQYGLPGQMLKADEEEWNRIWPSDNFTVCRLCTTDNQNTVLAAAAWDPNDKYAYNTELHTAYYRNAAGTWFYMDPIDKSKLLFLHKTFIFDPVSKIFWFAQDPSVFIYLWKASSYYSTVTDTAVTPRDQTGVDYIVDASTKWAKTGGELPSPSEIVRMILKPTTVYESYSKYLVGDQMYDGSNHIYTYFDDASSFNFESSWSGTAKLDITVSFSNSDIVAPIFMEQDEYFIIQNFDEKIPQKRYSDGILKVSLNDRPNESVDGNLINTNIIHKGYGNWSYSVSKTVTLKKNTNYISCWTKTTAYNHLYVNKVVLTVSYA